tara:strand:+ start:62 stop:586 length:525 start_codon:yes stop_codon:yes gene_type:complete
MKNLFLKIQNLINKINMERRMKPNVLFVFDYDNTLVEAVGTYERDFDLGKFEKDNTFLNNLKTKKLPLAESCNYAYRRKDAYCVIMSARADTWWFPLLLWLKGIKYDLLLLRHRGNALDTPSLKRNLMFKLLQDNLGQFTTRIFVDDVQENLDAIKQTFPEFVVINAETLRREK